MARIRSIKPGFWDDEKLSGICRDARLLFIGMWNFSDDYGVVRGHPFWLRNKIFPYDDDLEQALFNKWLMALEEIKAIVPFNRNGERYYFIRTFADHQAINRPSQVRNPEVPEDILNQPDSPLTEESVRTHGVLTEDSRQEREGKGNRKGNRKGGETCARKRTAHSLPERFSIGEHLKEWASREVPTVEIAAETEKFLDHHRSKGNRMVDWDAAWRKWMRNAADWGQQRARNVTGHPKRDVLDDMLDQAEREEVLNGH